MSKQISRLLELATIRLEEIDFSKLQGEFAQTNKVVREFINEFSVNYSELGPHLSQASIEATSLMKDISKLSYSINLMVQPNSELRFQFSDTMREVSLMSKSLKRLADLLERNPQAFLIGKPAAAKE